LGTLAAFFRESLFAGIRRERPIHGQGLIDQAGHYAIAKVKEAVIAATSR
jgi:hypothetical protein